jgi:hypothetical protein
MLDTKYYICTAIRPSLLYKPEQKYCTPLQADFRCSVLYWLTFVVKIKIKVFPVHAMQACRGSKGMDPLIHNVHTRCKLEVDYTPRLFTSWKKNHGTHWKWDLSGSRAGLDVLELVYWNMAAMRTLKLYLRNLTCGKWTLLQGFTEVNSTELCNYESA